MLETVRQFSPKHLVTYTQASDVHWSSNSSWSFKTFI